MIKKLIKLIKKIYILLIKVLTYQGMKEAKVIFIYEKSVVIIQCSKDEKMKDICQKYVNKINKDINSLEFLYGVNQLNFNLNFNEQANRIDKEQNIMKVLV